MTTQTNYYAIVIGAGAAGLEIAKGLAAAKKRVLLIDKGQYGADCAHFGCIPSNTFIASANIAHEIWRSGFFGIDMVMSNFQSNRALQRVREVVEEARIPYSAEALRQLGIDTYSSVCSFVDPHTVQVTSSDGQKQLLTAKSIVIAVGSCPKVAAIKGLDEVPYYTSENIFSLTEIPESIAIVGGGQTGCEFAQAFRRLGTSVTLIEQKECVLSTEEPEVHKLVQSCLIKEGVELYLAKAVSRVRQENDKLIVHIYDKAEDKEYQVRVSKLLIATGRRPNIETLNLNACGIDHTDSGIVSDVYGRTSQSHIWVIGDAQGEPFFTHAAVNQARTVLHNLLMPRIFAKKLTKREVIPRVTYTDPEVASIGLTEEEAITLYGNSKITTYIVSLTESDKAICQSDTDGFVKFVTKRFSSRILGCTLVAPVAAEALSVITLAMRENIPLRKLSHIIYPYPTYSQIIQKASQKWFSGTIFPLIPNFFK
ncbi:MAG: FAD-dependent oxidoreductase [Chlamydiales bacterium]|nr:FAD-dependent oxidoreductase [Chlamydiales bacterium]